MRRIVTLVIAVAVLLMSAGAFAQDDGGEQKSKFYDFEDMLVDGQIKRPDMERMDVQGNAKFDRLLDLKKSFLSKVQESTAEGALR